jgi:hypothetical protein
MRLWASIISVNAGAASDVTTAAMHTTTINSTNVKPCFMAPRKTDPNLEYVRIMPVMVPLPVLRVIRKTRDSAAGRGGARANSGP